MRTLQEEKWVAIKVQIGGGISGVIARCSSTAQLKNGPLLFQGKTKWSFQDMNTHVMGEFSKEKMKWKRLFFRFFPCLFFLAFVTYVVRGWSSFEVVWQRNKPRLSDTSPFDGFNAYKLHVLLCLNILLVKGLVKWFHCRPQNDIIILQLVLTGSRIVPSWKRINSLYSNSFCHYQMAYIN